MITWFGRGEDYGEEGRGDKNAAYLRNLKYLPARQNLCYTYGYLAPSTGGKPDIRDGRLLIIITWLAEGMFNIELSFAKRSGLAQDIETAKRIGIEMLDKWMTDYGMRWA